MNFRRNKQEEVKKESSEAPSPSVINRTEPMKLPPKQEQEEQKSIFAPKRFNLKAKDIKNDDNVYATSNGEIKKEQPKVEEYRPKGISIREEPLFTDKEDKLAAQQETIQEKPRFNLKLKDRKKDSNKQELKLNHPGTIKESEYVPPTLSVNPNEKPDLNQAT